MQLGLSVWRSELLGQYYFKLFMVIQILHTMSSLYEGDANAQVMVPSEQQLGWRG
jgi:hypothetical protein